VIVAPGNPRVIPLEPEFVTPQDGHEKQDCENAAKAKAAIPTPTASSIRCLCAMARGPSRSTGAS
jgi:hypothetical protein